MPVNRTFEQQRVISETLQSNRISTNAHGVNFAYSFKRNWWFRAGIRSVSFDFQNAYSMSVAYDGTNERPLSDGTISNELALRPSTSYSELRSTIPLIFEPIQRLDDEATLEVRILDRHQFNYLQIPFGVDYFYGTSKLKWLIQGGFQWNRISSDGYYFTSFFEVERRPILIDERQISIGSNVGSKQFFSTYGGLGLDYEIFKNWHARAAFNYHYNFIQNTINLINSTKSGTTFKLGLNYRF